jgi:hypothetical protein
MSKFSRRVKYMSQKAAELKAAMLQLPPKVAEIREVVASTAGQLQQLKSEIHSSVADLKADNEDRLSHALQEINSSKDEFVKAGFVISGVDLEISPVPRMLVHLAKVEQVHASMLRPLLSANQHRRTTHAILASLLQAKQMADTVELDALDYSEVIVGVGPIPSVRLCWRMEYPQEAEAVQSEPAIPVPSPVAVPAPAPPSVFGQSSFFERRTAQPEPAPVAAQRTASAVPANKPLPSTTMPAREPVIETPRVGSSVKGKEDPLARFKKMPDFSKYKK